MFSIVSSLKWADVTSKMQKDCFAREMANSFILKIWIEIYVTLSYNTRHNN